MNKKWPRCADCPLKIEDRACLHEGKKTPPFCPMTLEWEALEKAAARYQEPVTKEFARLSSVQEAAGYQVDKTEPRVRRPVKPRLLEVAEFSARMGYRRLGLAFCIGLRQEAVAVTRFFQVRGFEVVSVFCKTGRVPKEVIGVKDSEKINPGEPEIMCNPIGQAEVLNAAGTDFNIALGLCVGHDSLFFKYSRAPVTVLAAKDRVTGHNPLAAVYTLNHYYAGLLKP